MNRPIRIEYNPHVDALAIDFVGAIEGASAKMMRLDRDRAIDYNAEGRLISIELLNVSGGVEFDGLPEAEVVRRALELIGPQETAAA
jgi:uncharacterized protein YuzE